MTTTWIFLAAALAVSAPPAVADDGDGERIRMAGSFSLARHVIEPNLARIEDVCGASVELSPSSSREGLRALLAGDADIALISAPLASVARGDPELSEAVRGKRLRQHLVGASQLRVVANPRLDIGELTKEQVAAIFAGDITRWSEVGGPDIPVTVLTPPAGEGSRESLRRYVLKGRTLSGDATELARTDFIVRAVKLRAGAIGVIDEASFQAAPDLKLVGPELSIGQPLFLVTLPDTAASTERLLSRTYEVFSAKEKDPQDA